MNISNAIASIHQSSDEFSEKRSSW